MQILWSNVMVALVSAGRTGCVHFTVASYVLKFIRNTKDQQMFEAILFRKYDFNSAPKKHETMFSLVYR